MSPSPKGKIFFALAAVVIFFVLLEISARIHSTFRPDYYSLRFHQTYLFPDRDLLWVMPPGDYLELGVKIHINSLGMRGPELKTPKPKGEYRLLFLGDSSVYGDGVVLEESFPFAAGAKLEAATGSKVTVANGSLPGYSSAQAKRFFMKYADQIQPDGLVVATLWSDSIGRQITDDQLYARWDDLGFNFVKDLRQTLRISYLFQGIETLVERNKEVPPSRVIDWESLVRGDEFQPKSRVSIEGHRENLKWFVDEARRRRMDLYFLILPYEKDLYRNVPQKTMNYRANFGGLSQSEKIPLADLSITFAGLDKNKVHEYFIDGLHPTPTGHELISKALAEVIANHWEDKTPE